MPDLTQKQEAALKKLTPYQKNILLCLKSFGPWQRGCSWGRDAASETRRTLISFVEKGLAEKKVLADGGVSYGIRWEVYLELLRMNICSIDDFTKLLGEEKISEPATPVPLSRLPAPPVIGSTVAKPALVEGVTDNQGDVMTCPKCGCSKIKPNGVVIVRTGEDGEPAKGSHKEEFRCDSCQTRFVVLE